MSETVIWVFLGVFAWLLWLVLSEVHFRRGERLKAKAHAEYLRLYNEQTERLYGGGGRRP